MGFLFIRAGSLPRLFFRSKKRFQNINLVAFITELPESGLADPLAGTTGVELFEDGKSQGHRSVDRLTNQSFLLDFTQAKELKVVVDCANGNANWDHFHIGIAQESQAQ